MKLKAGWRTGPSSVSNSSSIFVRTGSSCVTRSGADPGEIVTIQGGAWTPTGPPFGDDHHLHQQQGILYKPRSLSTDESISNNCWDGLTVRVLIRNFA